MRNSYLKKEREFMKLYKKLTYLLFLLPLFSIMLFDNSAIEGAYTTTNLTNNSSGVYSYEPQINNNGQMVWYQYNSSTDAKDIYLYNGTTTTNLTNNSSGTYAYEPQINNNGQVVWYQYNSSLDAYDIYLYDGATTTNLTNNSSGMYSYEPQINNNGQVVWTQWNSSTGADDIYLYDGATTTNLTNNSSGASAYEPQINNNGQVVWTQSNGSTDAFDIYLAVPTIQNNPPVANAGPDQSVYVNDTVTLDGSGSTDADGNLLTYSWTVTSTPAGSLAALSSSTSVNPTFTVDKAGTYVVSLMVNDGTVNSAADTVTISTLNSAPVANAGADQTPYVNDTVTLDGSGSYDVDGNLLTYSWAFTTVPAGSSAALSSSTSVNPTFTVDKAGTYEVSLIVNDGTVDSAADMVTIST